MQYKCCCSHPCYNLMDEEEFISHFGICKECFYAGPAHIEVTDHNRSSYSATVAERYTQEA